MITYYIDWELMSHYEISKAPFYYLIQVKSVYVSSVVCDTGSKC